MRFTNDSSKICEACGSDICAGKRYQIYKTERKEYITCADEDCMKNLLFELYEYDFEEKYINTASDNEDVYGDMIYHERFAG